jgi:hypothetical protein
LLPIIGAVFTDFPPLQSGLHAGEEETQQPELGGAKDSPLVEKDGNLWAYSPGEDSS